MLSRRSVWHVKYRLDTTKFCGGTITAYDKTTGRIVTPHIFVYLNLVFGVIGGIFFCSFHALQIYMKLHKNEIPDEMEELKENTEADNMYEFATIVIGWGELGVIISIIFVNLQSVLKKDEIIFLFNEMFDYSKKLEKIHREINIELDGEHQKSVKKFEHLVIVTSYASIILGFLLMLTCLHPLEPTHALIKDWLEVDLDFTLNLMPFMFLFQMVIHGSVNVVVTVGMLVECNVFLASTVLQDLTVESVSRRNGARTSLDTRFYGIMEDQEICMMYRIQKHLNDLLNEVMGSVLISFHQVGMFASFSIMLFFFVKFQSVIWDVGPLACVVVVSSLLTPLAISFYHSMYFGKLVDISDEFKEKGMTNVSRKTMFRRFVLGCQSFYVEEAYPFFHFHTNTFLEFCAAGLDYAITLMLWFRNICVPNT